MAAESEIPRDTWVVRRGDTATLTYVWRETSGGTVIPLTGWTFKFQARLSEDDAATLVDSETDAGCVVTVAGAAGKVTVTLSPALTAALDFDEGVFDLEGTRTSDGFVSTFVQGPFILDRDTTR